MNMRTYEEAWLDPDYDRTSMIIAMMGFKEEEEDDYEEEEA